MHMILTSVYPHHRAVLLKLSRGEDIVESCSYGRELNALSYIVADLKRWGLIDMRNGLTEQGESIVAACRPNYSYWSYYLD